MSLNYKPLTQAKLKEFMEKLPEYSIGNILYAALSIKFKNTDFCKGDLFSLEDEEFYGLLSKALVVELKSLEED
jgi:hypothetical protein